LDNLANLDQCKTDEFYLSLRDNALQWYNTLDNIIGFDKEVWAELKKKFLEAYTPKYSAKALCICFKDLPQSEESVQDLYNCVSRLPCTSALPNKSACTRWFGSVHCGRGDKSSGAILPTFVS
jgi:hypothetical protein